MLEDEALIIALIFIFLSFGWIFYNLGHLVNPDDPDD
jgi:hypothetical protein